METEKSLLELSSTVKKLNVNSNPSSSSYSVSISSYKHQASVLPLVSSSRKRQPRRLVSLCLGVIGQHLEDILSDICEIAEIFPPDIKMAIMSIARRRKLLMDDHLIALADGTWEILDVSGSCITDAGLSKAVDFCRSLRAIDISQCDHITEQSVSNVVLCCPSLETLRCGGSPSSNSTARKSLKYLKPSLKNVEAESWEALDNINISSGAPLLRWLVWPKVDANSVASLSDCPQISINSDPILFEMRGIQVPREALPDVILDDPAVDDIDPEIWGAHVTPPSRRSVRISGDACEEIPIAEKFRIAYEERDARLAPKRAKNARQHQRRATKKLLNSDVEAKSFAYVFRASKFLRHHNTS